MNRKIITSRKKRGICEFCMRPYILKWLEVKKKTKIATLKWSYTVTHHRNKSRCQENYFQYLFVRTKISQHQIHVQISVICVSP